MLSLLFPWLKSNVEIWCFLLCAEICALVVGVLFNKIWCLIQRVGRVCRVTVASDKEYAIRLESRIGDVRCIAASI